MNEHAVSEDTKTALCEKALIQDDQFPQLINALNMQYMSDAFKTFFKREYPDRFIQVDDVAIGRLIHKPGRRCKVSWKLWLRDSQKGIFTTFFVGHLLKKGKTILPEETVKPEQWPGCDYFKPVQYWAELDAVLFAFPYDKSMDALGMMLEEDFIRQKINENKADFGFDNQGVALDVTIEPVKYMPKKRAIIKYSFSPTIPSNDKTEVVFYGKTSQGSGNLYVYNILKLICKSEACVSNQLRVPQPIAYLEKYNTLWLHALPGEKLRSFLKKPDDWQLFLSDGYAEKLAQLLLTLHEIEIDRDLLHPAEDWKYQIANIRKKIKEIKKFSSEHAAFFEHLHESMFAQISMFDAEYKKTTIHGTFKIAQIMCSNNELSVLDFDGISYGDPVYDLGELFASIAYSTISDAVPCELSEAIINKIKMTYERHAKWPLDEDRLNWYISAFLIGKVHSSMKRHERFVFEKMAAVLTMLTKYVDHV